MLEGEIDSTDPLALEMLKAFPFSLVPAWEIGMTGLYLSSTGAMVNLLIQLIVLELEGWSCLRLQKI
ncbi:hypothetical protein JCM10914A_51600 [Paenibacillus sp. JCM 10914]|nr:hypothetical protein JCM10914_1235 [Paenibacillus sp. JCM 10914]